MKKPSWVCNILWCWLQRDRLSHNTTRFPVRVARRGGHFVHAVGLPKAINWPRVSRDLARGVVFLSTGAHRAEGTRGTSPGMESFGSDA